MRVLHTSDWHLGASLESVSREPDHRLFLEWLIDTIRDRKVEVLVVAGDIFDHLQPSAEALRTNDRFGGGPQGTYCPQVVVVAGNQDSAAGLEVLDTVGVHVVGGGWFSPHRMTGPSSHWTISRERYEPPSSPSMRKAVHSCRSR